MKQHSERWKAQLIDYTLSSNIAQKDSDGQNKIKTTGLRDDDYLICIYIGPTLPIVIDVVFPI